MSDLQCKIIQQASDLSFDNNNHPGDQYLQIWTPITINNRLFTMILSEHVSTCNEMPKDVITSRIGVRLRVGDNNCCRISEISFIFSMSVQSSL